MRGSAPVRWPETRGIGVLAFNQDLVRHLMEKYGEEEGGVLFPVEEWLAEPPDWKR